MNNDSVVQLITFAASPAYVNYLTEDLSGLGIGLQVTPFDTKSYPQHESGSLQVALLTSEAVYTREGVLKLMAFHRLTERFRNLFFIITDVAIPPGLPVLHPERVSQVIHAIKFWQEAYLDLQAETANPANDSDDLSQLEQINASIGDIVRDISTARFLSFRELVEERYESLLQFLQIPLSEHEGSSIPAPLRIEDYFPELREPSVTDDDSRKPAEPDEPVHLLDTDSDEDESELLTLDEILADRGHDVEEIDIADDTGAFPFHIGPSDLPGGAILDKDDWRAMQDAQDTEGEFREEERDYGDHSPETEGTPLTESDLNLYRRLARLYADKNDLKRAQKMIRKAIKKGDRSVETEVIYAKLLLKAGKRRRALDKWLQTCKKDPLQFNAATAAVFGLPDSAVSLIEKGFEKTTVLRSETVLVTGATSGIGEAVAKAFAREGYKVIIAGRREKRLLSLQSELERLYHARVYPLTLDIRNRNEVEESIKQLPEEWSHVHVLVNNAGLAKGLASIHEGNPDDWDLMIDTNIKGLLYLTRALSTGMVARGKGHIINIGSVSGKEVYPAGNVYCATKFAVDGLTRAMRLDLYQKNIRVSAVSPGHVETEFALVRFDGDREKADIYSDFRPLSAEDVAEVVLFVATRPERVNIQDVLMFSSQQAGAVFVDRSGRKV